MSSSRIPVSWVWPPTDDPRLKLPAPTTPNPPASPKLLAISGPSGIDPGPVVVGRLHLGRDVLRRRLAEAGTRRRSRRPPAQGWQRRRDQVNSSLSRSRVSTHGRRRR